MKKRRLFSLLLMMIAVMVMSMNAQAAAKISKKSVVLIKGQSVTLKITGTKEKVKWLSNKKAVATVTQKGVVKAKAKGTAIISAKVGKKTFKCKVKVETPKINKTEATLLVGTKFTLKISGNTQKVKWSSNKKTIAAITQKGVVTAKKAGKATITATIAKKKYTCKITIEQPKLSRLTVLMEVGDNYNIDVNGTSMDVTWTSSNSNVVSVDDGELYAESPGTAIITASVGGKKLTCTVSVENPVTSVQMSDSSVTLTEGDTYTLSATYSPANTTDDTTVTWTSSNENVVKVSNGTLLAQNAGTAVITATISSQSAFCTVVVNEYVPTMADYYQYLKTYITKNGLTNSDGNKFIKFSYTKSDSTYNFAIVYLASEDTLKFIMTGEYDNTESSVSMYVDVINDPYVDPEYILVFTDSYLAFKATAHIFASAYDGENDVFFRLENASDSFFTTSNIQDISNSSVRLAFAGWNTLLQNRVAFSFVNLGFSSYKG